LAYFSLCKRSVLFKIEILYLISAVSHKSYILTQVRQLSLLYIGADLCEAAERHVLTNVTRRVRCWYKCNESGR